MVSDANLREIERRRLEEAEAESAEIDRTPVRTYWQLVRQRFLRHRTGGHGASSCSSS